MMITMIPRKRLAARATFCFRASGAVYEILSAGEMMTVECMVSDRRDSSEMFNYESA